MNALELTVSLLLALLQGIDFHYAPSTIESLKGQEYLEIPVKLCGGSAETLFGEFEGREYSGLICTQTTDTYIVLQELVGYQGSKAILKAVDIQQLPPLRTGERSVNRGCVEVSSNSAAIVAIVRDIGTPVYQVMRAWHANLKLQKFEEISPQSVVCKRLW